MSFLNRLIGALNSLGSIQGENPAILEGIVDLLKNQGIGGIAAEFRNRGFAIFLIFSTGGLIPPSIEKNHPEHPSAPSPPNPINLLSFLDPCVKYCSSGQNRPDG